MISYIATIIVGAVFLFTGVIKALSSGKFIEQIFRYDVFPQKIVPSIAILFIGLECALGTGLMLHAFPQWLVPGTIALLIGLSLLTIWSTSSGRTEDCGCYGGLLIITPKQSVLLNLVYISLLGLAWLYPIPNYQTEPWQWILALVALLVGSIAGWKSQEKPIVDFSRLKPEKRWQQSWLKNSLQDLQKGSHFVVFLGKDCPYCKQWVPLMNVMNTQQDLPNVMGIMSITEEEIADFKAEHLVRFPVAQMNKLLFGYMVDAVPTAVLVEDGVISSKWEGEMPKEFFERIKQFYEAVVFESKPKTSRFSG